MSLGKMPTSALVVFGAFSCCVRIPPTHLEKPQWETRTTWRERKDHPFPAFQPSWHSPCVWVKPLRTLQASSAFSWISPIYNCPAKLCLESSLALSTDPQNCEILSNVCCFKSLNLGEVHYATIYNWISVKYLKEVKYQSSFRLSRNLFWMNTI